jgi:RNA polymerase sigma-70 factor (ECF subfamily)
VAADEASMTMAASLRRGEQKSPSGDLTALVKGARAGDAASWESLYRLLYPRLLGYARRRLPAEAACDAVSETMARAIGAIEAFRPKGAGFEGWLFGILRHVVLDAQRASARHARRSVPWADHDVDPSTPLDEVVHGEEAAAVRGAFARLSPAERELLELRVVCGLGAADVGTVVGKRPGAVRVAQSRALARLRTFMEASS